MSRRKKRRKHHGAAVAERIAPRSLAPAAIDPAPESMTRLMKPVVDSAEERAAAVMGAVLESLTTSLGIPSEHRAYPRVDLHVEIDLHSESHFFTGLSGDVSEGGLFVQTYRPLHVGQEVDVSFDLDEGRVEARAFVAWHRDRTATCEPGFGLAFRDLTEGDREIIRGFCERRAPLYYEVV